MTYTDIISRLEAATGPDRYADCHMWVVAQGGDARMVVCDCSEKSFVWERGVDGFWIRGVVHFRQVPKYTASVDAAKALVEQVLPGWGYHVGHCSVSDDAWMFPDFNCPVHGGRLRAELDEKLPWSEITDVDLRPPGRLAIALLISLFRALEAKGGAA